MTNVLDEFDQKGYLEVALERMAYQKALGCPGWQLLLPVTDALAKNGIDPKKIELKVLKITEFNPESLKSREFKVTLSFEIDCLADCLPLSLSQFMLVVGARLE